MKLNHLMFLTWIGLCSAITSLYASESVKDPQRKMADVQISVNDTPVDYSIGSEGLIVEDLPFDLIWGRDALNESGTEIRGVGGSINVSEHVEKYFLLQETDDGGVRKVYFLDEAKKSIDK